MSDESLPVLSPEAARPTTAKSQVRVNAEKDPTYCPYCMRCSGLIRMQKVEDFYWRCAVCRAEHDERNPPAVATPIVADPTVPPDEIHLRGSVTGKLLGKIVGVDPAPVVSQTGGGTTAPEVLPSGVAWNDVDLWDAYEAGFDDGCLTISATTADIARACDAYVKLAHLKRLDAVAAPPEDATGEPPIVSTADLDQADRWAVDPGMQTR